MRGLPLLNYLGDMFGARPRAIVLSPYARPRVGIVVRALAILAFALFCWVFGFFYALTTPFLLKPLMAPLAILGLLAIWALPDMKTSPSGPLAGLCFSFIVIQLLWPNYLAVALPGLPWITLIRLVTIPLAFLLLVSISVSKEFRSNIKDILESTPAVWKFILAFSVLQLITIAFSPKVPFSIQRVVVHHLTCTVIFFASCYVFAKPTRVERWAVFLWISAIILCFVGVLESKMMRPPWGAHVPSFLKVEDELILQVLAGSVRSATGQYRVQTTFTTSLGLSEFLALTAPFVLHFAIYYKNKYIKLAAILSLPLMFYVVITTDSRLGVIGFLLAFMLYLLVWAALRWKTVKSSLLGPAFVLAYPAIFVLFVAATFVVGRLRNMVWGSGDTASSDGARVIQYNLGIPMVVKQPWGYGPGMAADTLGFTTPNGMTTIDTYYLAIALDYGVIGFLLFYGIIVASIYYSGKAALRSPKGEFSFFIPLSIALTNFFVTKSVFSQVDNNPIVFMMMGVGCALAYRQATELGSGSVAEVTGRPRLSSNLKPARRAPLVPQPRRPA